MEAPDCLPGEEGVWIRFFLIPGAVRIEEAARKLFKMIISLEPEKVNIKVPILNESALFG